MRPLSAKEQCILELLTAGQKLYGLELVEASQGVLKRGTVYVTLTRMEDKGLVEGRPDLSPESHSGLPRRTYRVTALGARLHAAQCAFERILRQPRRMVRA